MARASGQASVCFSAAGSARSSFSCLAGSRNTPRWFASTPAAGAPWHIQTGIPLSAPRCRPPRQKRSCNACTASGMVATRPGSSTPIAAARSTEGLIRPPRPFDTTPARTENAPGSGLQRPEALAQDALATVNSPVLPQRRFGVDVGQGLFFALHLHQPLLGKRNTSPSIHPLDHFP